MVSKQTKLRKSRLLNGLCCDCGKNPYLKDMTRCSSCREKHNSRSRQRKERRKKQGLCPCGNLVADGFVSCAGCRKKAASRHENKVLSSTLNNRCKRCNSDTNEIFCANCKQVLRDQKKKCRQKLKKSVMSHYGGECSCCGESELAFLTIDHIENNGSEHRKSLPDSKFSTGERFYRWLRDNNYPDGFQVLCMNCNFGKHLNNGVCPHVGKYTNKVRGYYA